MPLPINSADVTIPFVQTLRLHGSSDLGDRLTLIATVAWEDWSSFDNLLISTDIGTGALVRDWKDTWKFALDLRGRTGGPWMHYTGIAYDTSPTSASKRTADMPMDEQLRLSVGTNYTLKGGKTVGGAITYVDYGDARIDNGDDWGQVVGKYSTNRIWFVSLNIGWEEALSNAIHLIVVAIGVLFVTVAPQAAESVHWSYTGDTGPAHWAELAPEFAACGIGVNQSPIDIVNTVAATLEPLEFDYRSGSVDIVNNGHTLQVNVEPGSWLRIRGEAFQLQQLHFHSPSEHQINGEAFPLEAHLVHQGEQGALAVVSVLFRAGAWNKELERIGMAGPQTIGQSAPFEIDFQALELYRRHQSYFRYSGSLTTPPCTEGVRWYILKSAESIAPEQAANFVALIGKDARGPQPLNARVVLER